MKHNKYQIILYFVFTVHFIAMLLVAINYAFNQIAINKEMQLFQYLIFGEPFVFLIIILGCIKKVKSTFPLGLILLIINALLTIFDEVGIIDIAYIVFTLFSIFLLVKFRKEVF
jgi:hypothetical protein